MKKRVSVLAWPAFDYEPFNPYNWLLNKKLEKIDVEVIPFSPINALRKHYDVWHMHWPEENVIKESIFGTFYRFIGFFFLLIIAKVKGAKIVWTAHNTELHDRVHPGIEHVFWSIFPWFVDTCINHSHHAKKILLDKHQSMKDKRHYVIPHGHYKDWYKNEIEKEDARLRLDIKSDSFVFIFIGRIRPYKNVSLLAKEFSKIRKKEEILLIAGKPSTEEAQGRIEKTCRQYENIIFHPKWIDDEEFQIYFNASDLVVLPYKILNSGIAMLALSFERPILMPNNPMMEEYQNLINQGLVFLYEGEIDSGVLIDTKKEINSSKKSRRQYSLPEMFDWEYIAHRTKLVYENTISES